MKRPRRQRPITAHEHRALELLTSPPDEQTRAWLIVLELATRRIIMPGKPHETDFHPELRRMINRVTALRMATQMLIMEDDGVDAWQAKKDARSYVASIFKMIQRETRRADERRKNVIPFPPEVEETPPSNEAA